MLTEMKDPRVHLASVSRVTIAPDLRVATVMISAVGDDPERRAVVDAMRHAEGYLRAQLGHRLENLKSPPHLQFQLDEFDRLLGADEQPAARAGAHRLHRCRH